MSEEERIIDHLSRLLNTYHGYGSMMPKFGLGGYAYASSREKAIACLKQDIRKNIELFDQRVRVKNIEFIDENDIFNWRFRIECVFNVGDNRVLSIEMCKQTSQVKIEREDSYATTT